jgi:hypothetical protein
MHRPAADFRRILETLCRHRVDFIVVGGVGAVLQGAPLSTFDLDVVHSRSPENVQRLLAALSELHAAYRGRGAQRIPPQREPLESPGHQLLMTDAGPLDLLGVVGDNRSFEDLRTDTVTLRLSDNVEFLVLSLAALVRLKEALGRDKDRAVLAVLRRTIEENERRADDD